MTTPRYISTAAFEKSTSGIHDHLIQVLRDYDHAIDVMLKHVGDKVASRGPYSGAQSGSGGTMTMSSIVFYDRPPNEPLAELKRLISERDDLIRMFDLRLSHIDV